MVYLFYADFNNYKIKLCVYEIRSTSILQEVLALLYV